MWVLQVRLFGQQKVEASTVVREMMACAGLELSPAAIKAQEWVRHAV